MQLRRLKRFSQKSARKTDLQPPSYWLSKLHAIATTLGWPGDRTLDSDEFQQLSKFQQCIEEFKHFDTVLGKVSFNRAYNAFLQHCRATVYHRETVTQANVPQVLGLLEAGGQLFDYLWITGLSDRQWPLVSNPSSMIPESLQIERRMPSASIEVEIAYARSISSGFLAGAKNIVLSYPSRLDESETRLSPLVEGLINDLGKGKTASCSCDEWLAPDVIYPKEVDQDSPFELLPDFYGEPLTDITLGIVSNTKALASDALESSASTERQLPGGAGMLITMASNPLKAYARWRLRIEPLPPALVGVSALERGILIHGILEAVWRQLKSQQSLLMQSSAELEEIIQQALDFQFKQVFARRFRQPGPQLLALERQTLSQVVKQWLSLESERPEFTINALEKTISLNLQGFQVRGRIDRIDRLANGQLMLIDYKTGQFRSAAMLETPLYEPQLPFYLLALRQEAKTPEVAALAFAGLKPGYLKMQGYGSGDALEIPGITAVGEEQSKNETWQSLPKHWHSEIASLVEKAIVGNAMIDLDTHGLDLVYESFLRMQYAESDLRLTNGSL